MSDQEASNFWLILLPIFFLVSVWMAIDPYSFWGLFKSVRFKDPDAVEPSNIAIWWFRIRAILGALFFAGAFVFLLTKMR